MNRVTFDLGHISLYLYIHVSMAGYVQVPGEWIQQTIFGGGGGGVVPGDMLPFICSSKDILTAPFNHSMARQQQLTQSLVTF